MPKEDKHSTDIAIIGMACRFPEADDYNQYWSNLERGINSIKEIPPERWDTQTYYSSNIHEPNKSPSKWVGLVDRVDLFDNQFFHISPREAGNIDPQQRLLLEETWHCIEDAGIPLQHLQEKRTSVFMGVMTADYRQEAVAPGVETDSYACLGNYENVLANRLSYAFNLQGPSVSINAACASSSVAMHEAKRSLTLGESDYALAGGVSLNLHPWKYISFGKSRMLSPDGQCKTFDKDANGYVPGDGVGVLLLQRLDDAVKAGNRIYGIIKGTAVNHGGRGVSITAPRVEAQRDVILSAYRDAGITPDTVTYVEAHGTGTSLGDPIEVESLTRAYRSFTDAKQFCKIGSVKTNIGHLEAAAGVAGVIKVLMMMKHRQVAPSLNIRTVNPIIQFEQSPFQVATELSEWHPAEGQPLRAGVSSFGFGGANSHVLVEEYVGPVAAAGQGKSRETGEDDGEKLFALSAKTESSLKKQIEAWKHFARSEEATALSVRDLSLTLLTGREPFPYRYGVAFCSQEELIAKLDEATEIFANKTNHAWALRIGESLLTGWAAVEAASKQFCLFKEQLDFALQALVALGDDALNKGFKRKQWAIGKRPLYNFLVAQAYVNTLLHLGVVPTVVTGEGTGLWTALTVSGIVSLEDAVAVLSRTKKPEQVTVSRPVIPFHDPVTQATIQPHVVTERDLQNLLALRDAKLGGEVSAHYFEKARLLATSQFTFKRHMEEWNPALKAAGLEAAEVLLGNEQLAAREEFLLLLIVVSSLRKLNQKWDLTEERVVDDVRWSELVDLVVEEVLPKNLVVSGLLEEQADLAGIAATLNERANLRGYRSRNAEVMAEGAVVQELRRLAGWLQKAQNSTASLPDGVACLTFGEVRRVAGEGELVEMSGAGAEELQRALFELWLHGVNIRWSALYPDGTFRKVGLPVYEFDREKFWFPNQGVVQTVAASAAVAAQADVADVAGVAPGRVSQEEMVNDTPVAGEELQRLHEDVLQVAASILKVHPQDMDVEEALEDYGLDPVRLFELTSELQARYGVELPVNVWVEHPSIAAVARYLVATQGDAVCGYLAAQPNVSRGQSVQASDEELERVTLVKKWQERAVARTEQPPLSGTVIVLANEITKATASELLQGLPGVQALVAETDWSNEEQGRAIAREILTRGDTLTGLIDLSDLRSLPLASLQISYGKIAFLQELIGGVIKQPNEFRLLHMTRWLLPLQASRPTLAGADTAALVKMLGSEYRKLQVRTVDVDLAIDAAVALRGVALAEWAADDAESEVVYRGGKRYLPHMRNLSDEAGAPLVSEVEISPDKVYVITGGVRGIGAEIAKHLVHKGARKLVLMGLQAFPPRAEWAQLLQAAGTDAGLKQRLQHVLALEEQGVSVELYAGALTEREALQAFFQNVRDKLGQIGGIVHCAGVLLETTPAFIRKPRAEMDRVFEPKILGLQVLHELFAADRPDFSVLFSSVSGIIPALGAGLSDYAIANAFMDAFVAYQHSQGHEYYQAIQWPNWKEVGMGDVAGPVYLQLGLTAHTTADGLAMLDRAMERSAEHVTLLPAVVRRDQFDAGLLMHARQELKPQNTTAPTVKAAAPVAQTSATVASTVQFSVEDTKQKLKELLAEELRISQEKMDDNTTFAEYGVDSILLTGLVRKVEEWLDLKLDPSLFLEYPTLKLISEYLHPIAAAKLAPKLGSQVQEAVVETIFEAVVETAAAEEVSQQQKPSTTLQSRVLPLVEHTVVLTGQASPSAPTQPQKIAVVGMACHFPEATDKDAYWRNLTSGRNSIVEVPKSRWDADALYSPVQEKGKSISKWGGFLDGIEEFDPRYFQIHEDDAPHVDPLVRQFLEVSVQTFRDAGYEKEDLWNRKVGVFVGSRVAGYAPRIKQPHKNTIIGMGQNFIAAHVSHLFNFKGPNMVIDTACSSSLVSIHLACQSLMSGESEVALAGGVDILLDEQLYLILSEGKALSPDGKCHTFDEKANGFVPGEGAGAVLLKPLDKAVADGDRIYAVIDVTHVNNDGNTMGITTPNPEAQSDMIREALNKGSLSPTSISYVETHGTGTMIGDPIELKALTRTFREYTDEKRFCAVGSVKTNIGHLLSAAGVASFIKVALSLYHKQLPPTLNCETPNPRFEFDQSPFYPNTELKAWPPREGVRRASISSFGFGGTNAHAILAEAETALPSGYQPTRAPLPPVQFNRKRYWLDAVETVATEKCVEPVVAKTPSHLPPILEFVEEV
jgi:acyl transferase domain-containing protein